MVIVIRLVYRSTTGMSRLRGTENRFIDHSEPIGFGLSRPVSFPGQNLRQPGMSPLGCRKTETHRNLLHLDGARAETRQIGERLVEVAVEKEARYGHAKELFDKTSGIRLGNCLKGIGVIAADIHVQRHVVRDDLIPGGARSAQLSYHLPEDRLKRFEFVRDHAT